MQKLEKDENRREAGQVKRETENQADYVFNSLADLNNTYKMLNKC